MNTEGLKTKVVNGETYYGFADDNGEVFWISEATLRGMDEAMENYKKGNLSEPIDLKKLRRRRK